ncbi:MAG: hypothetical protein LBB36_05175 [Fibromonadaceae bacterium]|nr:hypothetical protein [Fibromonadaceae bacterium]
MNHRYATTPNTLLPELVAEAPFGMARLRLPAGAAGFVRSRNSTLTCMRVHVAPPPKASSPAKAATICPLLPAQ